MLLLVVRGFTAQRALREVVREETPGMPRKRMNFPV